MQLYEPINTLKPIAENIWIVDGPIVRMDMYGVKIPFPTRMTIIRLTNGTLWCHSPTALTPTLQSEIETLGPVKHLVSPNKIHYASIGPWSKAYPEAIAWASPGVRERAAQQNISVEFDADLTDQPPAAWSTDIAQCIVRGSRFMDEVVFFHRSSKTLIITDLIENFELNKVSPGMAVLLHLAGNTDPDGKTPLDLRATFWGQKSKAQPGFKQMIAWQPERIILAHGRWYENHAIAELQRAFRWLG